MTYLSSFTDFFSGVVDLTVAQTYFTGFTITEADAYGTVILPGGTFDNCLRITRDSRRVDTTDLGLGIIELVVTDTYSHIWFSPEHPGTLAIYEESEFFSVAILDPLPPDTSATEYDTIFSFDPTAVSSGTQYFTPNTFDLTASPNPFSQELTVNFTLDRPERVSLEIYSTIGQLVDAQSIDAGTGSNIIQLDGSLLGPGTYTVLIRGSQKGAVQRIVKVE